MIRRLLNLHMITTISTVMLFTSLLFPLSAMAADGGRQIVSGPVSFSVRAGGENNSEMAGVDGRVDYLTRLINLHLFGTYEWLGAGRGMGEVDNKRAGAGIALSHTYPGKANAFVGTSFIRELGENYGHAYVGGKVKVTDYALLAATYGFGFGHIKEVNKLASKFFATESVDWLKAGVVLVNRNGWKLNAYYTLTDIKDQKLSGAEGEISYPVRDNLTFGVSGSGDLTKKDDVERNWRGSLFVTYAYGTQKGNPIDVALEKNSPVEYPRIVRRTSGGQITVTISGTTTIEPDFTNTFTANHNGTAPFTYSWVVTNTSGSSFNIPGASDAQTADVALDIAASPSDTAVLQVTVTDASGKRGTASVTLTVLIVG